MYVKMELRYWLVPGNMRNNRTNKLNHVNIRVRTLFQAKNSRTFQGLIRTLLEISRTFFNDNFISKPRKMFLLTLMFSWPSHCLEDFLRIICASSFMWLAMADFPILFRSMLLLRAKQNALFEFLSSFRSHDL